MDNILSFNYSNYYKSIEKDLENLSRYIEFDENNLKTYSTELVRIFLTSSSEVDVILKDICKILNSNSKIENINNFRDVIKIYLPEMINEEVIMPTHNLKFKPWLSWLNDNNPIWWKNHTNIKHHRNKNFHEANLFSTLNAVSALLICNLYYYRLVIKTSEEKLVSFKDITRIFESNYRFFRLNGDYYYHSIIG